MTSIADRLRELAEGLPHGGSSVLTREALLDLAAIRNRAVLGSNPAGGSPAPTAQAVIVSLCPRCLSAATRPAFSTDFR